MNFFPRWKDDSYQCADSHTSCKFHQNTTIEEFTSCAGNLAHNRQTRLLANLNVANCNKNKPTDTMKHKLLASAKLNLAMLPMFGLAEYLYATQYIFEWTFDLQFKKNIPAKRKYSNIPLQTITLIKGKNEYDLDLYKFALELFFLRLQYIVDTQQNENKTIPLVIEKLLKTHSAMVNTSFTTENYYDAV